MASINCSICNGSGYEYRPQNETCSTCGGNGKTYGYGDRCGRCGGSGTISVNKNVGCRVCGGSGTTYVQDAVRTNKSTKRTNRHSNKKTKTTNRQKSSNISSSGAQGFLGLIGFIVGGIFGYNLSDENLIAAGIVGFITAYLAYKFYQAIIVIAIIIGIIYLIMQNN